MKYIILAVALFSSVAFASEVNFKCEFSDITYLNQFSLEAKNVQIEDGKFSNVEFDFSLRRFGLDQKVERLVVTRDGTAQIFPAGEMYSHTTMRLASVVKNDEVQYINLLIDVPPLHTSQIRFLSGLAYFGSCKSIK